MKLLELTTETDGTTVRLALTGELDIAGAARVEQELERIEREPPATIVLDLRELAFMDSTGLRVIVAADGRARDQARRSQPPAAGRKSPAARSGRRPSRCAPCPSVWHGWAICGLSS